MNVKISQGVGSHITENRGEYLDRVNYDRDVEAGRHPGSRDAGQEPLLLPPVDLWKGGRSGASGGASNDPAR